MMYCPKCANRIRETEMICPHCSASLEKVDTKVELVEGNLRKSFPALFWILLVLLGLVVLLLAADLLIDLKDFEELLKK